MKLREWDERKVKSGMSRSDKGDKEIIREKVS